MDILAVSSHPVAPPEMVREAKDKNNLPLVVVHVALKRIFGLLSLQAILLIFPLLLAHLVSGSATPTSRLTNSSSKLFCTIAHCTDTISTRQSVHADSSGPKNSAVLRAQGGKAAHLLQL